MASVVIPYSFTNNTTADANQVNSNFTYLKSFIENNVVQTDGSTAVAAGSITLAKLASAVAEALCPTGSIMPFAGTVLPSGWLWCDGVAIPVQYSTLIAMVGANTPNLKGKTIYGRDTLDGDFASMFQTGGSKVGVGSHFHTADGTLSAAGGGSHNHGGVTTTAGEHSHTYEVGGVLGGNPADSSYVFDGGTGNFFSTQSAGSHQHGITAQGDHVHDVTGNTSSTGTANGNLPPYVVLNYIIKAA